MKLSRLAKVFGLRTRETPDKEAPKCPDVVHPPSYFVEDVLNGELREVLPRQYVNYYRELEGLYLLKEGDLIPVQQGIFSAWLYDMVKKYKDLD